MCGVLNRTVKTSKAQAPHKDSERKSPALQAAGVVGAATLEMTWNKTVQKGLYFVRKPS